MLCENFKTCLQTFLNLFMILFFVKILKICCVSYQHHGSTELPYSSFYVVWAGVKPRKWAVLAPPPPFHYIEISISMLVPWGRSTESGVSGVQCTSLSPGASETLSDPSPRNYFSYFRISYHMGAIVPHVPILFYGLSFPGRLHIP